MGQSYLLIAIFWAVYFTLHSLLASDGVKALASKLAPSLAKKYRLFYNIFAIASFTVFLVYFSTTKHNYLIGSYPALKLLGMISASFGVILAKKAFSAYSMSEFLGTNTSSQPLVTAGLQARMRHPLYTATILIFTGLLLYMPTVENLITWTCVMVYLPIGIHFEEQKLIKAYGQAYIDYKSKVPMLLPRWT